DDVIFAILVTVIDHRGQSCGFSGTRRSRDDDQPTMQHREFFQDRRQGGVEFFEILKRKHPAGNLSEDSGDPIFLIKEVRAKSRYVWDLVPEIDITGLFKDLDLVFRRDLIKHFLELIVLQRWMVHPMKFAVDAQHWVVARGKVEIGSLLLEHQIKECVDLGHMFCTIGSFY